MDFYFTKQEARGLLVLSVLLLLTILVRIVLPKIIPPVIHHKAGAAQDKPAPLFTYRPVGEAASHRKQPERFDPVYVQFDPNNVLKEQLLMMGVPPHVATNLIKYRNQGGAFRSKHDVLKIYGFDTLLYTQLVNYIRLPQELDSGSPNHPDASRKLTAIDLNSASAEQLMQFSGIGEVLSQRIVNYRASLGGFVNAEQLGEVYGISDSLVATIKNKLTVNDTHITRININKCTMDELAGHPYIEPHEARSVVKFRNYRNRIEVLDELEMNYVLPADKFMKLRPYLALE
jgi:competence ComEA-like helix-hairpin-helix protein